MKFLPIILLASSCSLGCNMDGHRFKSTGDMETFVKDPDNGLLRSREVNGIKTTVSILPQDLMERRDMERGAGKAASASVPRATQFKDQLTFIVNLATAQAAHGDVMYAGILDMGSYLERAHALNFEMEQHVTLRCGTAAFKPVLSTLENTYGLEPDRNIVMVFVPEQCDDQAFYGSETLDLVINDRWFGTGTQHFVFQRADLERFRIASTPLVKS
jgi:hypothetical protein